MILHLPITYTCNLLIYQYLIKIYYFYNINNNLIYTYNAHEEKLVIIYLGWFKLIIKNLKGGKSIYGKKK